MKNISKIIFITALCFFSVWVTAQTKNKLDTVVTTGKLITKPFITKNGKPIASIKDYYFQVEGEDYFIKLIESKITRDTLDKYLNQNIKLSYLIKTGEWDADGKEKIQSRVGKYIAVFRLRKN